MPKKAILEGGKRDEIIYSAMNKTGDGSMSVDIKYMVFINLNHLSFTYNSII